MSVFFRSVLFCIAGIAAAGIVSATVEIDEIVYSPLITGSHGILETTDGAVYISDSYGDTDAVYRIDTGTAVAVASGFDCPTGMWQDASGDIYVCDINAGRIYRFDASWTYQAYYNVPYPWTLVFDGDDIITASYDGNVYRISGGSATAIWTGLTDPFGIAIDASRNLYVSEYTQGRIKKRSPTGTVTTLVDGLGQPEGIRMGPDGCLWVADTLNGEVYRITMSGEIDTVDPQGHDFSIAVNLGQVRGDHMMLGCAGGNGRVYQLTRQPPTPTPTATPSATDTPTPSPEPTVTATPPCIHDGDVTLDAILSAADAQLAFMITLGSYSPTWDEACAADCNGDDAITAGDAQQIFFAVLGSGSCEDPIPYGP